MLNSDDRKAVTRRRFSLGALSLAATAPILPGACASMANQQKTGAAGNALGDVAMLPHREIAEMSAVDLSKAYKEKALSPVEVADAIVERIDGANEHVRAFFHISREMARVQAAKSEARWLRGAPLTPLDGVPVSFKDHFEVAGMPAGPSGAAISGSYGTRILDDDVGFVKTMRDAGMVFTGKTAMSEFGYAGTSASTAYPYARNPWDLSKTPGGSSSGAGVATAAGLGPIHVGSDGGGSIRIPSSYCGVFGLKTSARRLAASSNTVTVAGPLARSVEDAALAMNVMAKPVTSWPNQLPLETDDYFAALSSLNVKEMRFAFQPFSGAGWEPHPQISSVVEKAISGLRYAGLNIETIGPTLQDADIMLIWDVRRLQYAKWMLDQFGSAEVLEERLSPELFKATIGAFDQIGNAEELMANEAAIDEEVLRKLANEPTKKFDAVFSFTMPNLTFDYDKQSPPEYAEKAEKEGILGGYGAALAARNFNGNAAASIPCGFADDGMPVGLHVYAQPGEDLKVLSVSRFVEQALALDSVWPFS